MNHWLENSEKNLIPLSNATSFKEALTEWDFNGKIIDYEDERVECKLCEHSNLSHHFEIENKINKNKLLVGSSCILKFKEINVFNVDGTAITDDETRKIYLDIALRKELIDLMINPLREIWKKDIMNQDTISRYALKIKNGNGISPDELLFLFMRMDNFNINYQPRRYKISLRSYQNQAELRKMSEENIKKIKPALSTEQIKKLLILFPKLHSLIS